MFYHVPRFQHVYTQNVLYTYLLHMYFTCISLLHFHHDPICDILVEQQLSTKSIHKKSDVADQWTNLVELIAK